MYDLNHPLSFLERDPATGKFKLHRHDRRPKDLKLRVAAPTAERSVPFLRRHGGHIIILGAGIGGMTAAYDLLKMNLDPAQKKPVTVTVLEATGRVGGRSLTLRPGNPNNPTPADSFTEEVPLQNGDVVEVTQTCTFETEPNDPYPPYLNAGPGRIPSFHTALLQLCKELNVKLEVYVMESRSNLVWTAEGLKNHKGVNRQVANDIRGYVAEDLYDLLSKESGNSGFKNQETKQNFLKLLAYFGALETAPGPDGESMAIYVGSQRAGYTEFPGLYNAGEIRKPLKRDDLANARLWERSFYQAEDFEWQTTSFQPVGGMDMIHHALEREVVRLHQEFGYAGNPIHLNAPVKGLQRKGNKWTVEFEENGKIHQVEGDYVLSNIPMVLTQKLLRKSDFNEMYWSDLNHVVNTPDIMGDTCKVGWQAERKLWQEDTYTNLVPIFGGISRIEHPMTQMWYPSDNYHGRLGALTGAYNYTDQAERWGKMLPGQRIDEARQGAALLHDQKFANGLKHGISIAWQNIPTQKGGWTNWENIQSYEFKGQERTPVDILNNLRRGDHNFHIIGDQISFLPGWQEGAVLSALEVFAKVTEFHNYSLPVAATVPNTAQLVFGHKY
ncbi:MAG: FAD-dependent oxidoreductase [Bacteroidia bacterium]|nr:FAD-dependent oxidoreductase [Bacteroidia bacterium]